MFFSNGYLPFYAEVGFIKRLRFIYHSVEEYKKTMILYLIIFFKLKEKKMPSPRMYDQWEDETIASTNCMFSKLRQMIRQHHKISRETMQEILIAADSIEDAIIEYLKDGIHYGRAVLKKRSNKVILWLSLVEEEIKKLESPDGDIIPEEQAKTFVEMLSNEEKNLHKIFK